jgi:hypothetical protein
MMGNLHQTPDFLTNGLNYPILDHPTSNQATHFTWRLGNVHLEKRRINHDRDIFRQDMGIIQAAQKNGL